MEGSTNNDLTWALIEIQKRDYIIMQQTAQIHHLSKEVEMYKQLASVPPPLQSSSSTSTLNSSSSPSLPSCLSEGNFGKRYWSSIEHQLFLEGLHKFGKSWKSIAQHVKTRSADQVRTHAQKYFLRMEKEKGHSGDEEEKEKEKEKGSKSPREDQDSRGEHKKMKINSGASAPNGAKNSDSRDNAPIKLAEVTSKLNSLHPSVEVNRSISGEISSSANSPLSSNSSSPVISGNMVSNNSLNSKDQMITIAFGYIQEKIQDWSVLEHKTLVDAVYSCPPEVENKLAHVYDKMVERYNPVHPRRTLEEIRVAVNILSHTTASSSKFSMNPIQDHSKSILGNNASTALPMPPLPSSGFSNNSVHTQLHPLHFSTPNNMLPGSSLVKEMGGAPVTNLLQLSTQQDQSYSNKSPARALYNYYHQLHQSPSGYNNELSSLNIDSFSRMSGKQTQSDVEGNDWEKVM